MRWGHLFLWIHQTGGFGIQVRQNRHSQRQKGLLTLIATCLVPETYFRLRRSANTHRAMHPKTSYGHFETISAFPCNVIVQATCHGADNRALVDALESSNGMARGVATVKRDVTDEELARLHTAGVRGVRFNFVKRLVDALPVDSLVEIAGRIQTLGWHIVIYFEAQELPELYDFFTGLPTTVVVDHMGRPDVTKPVNGPEFNLFVKLLADNENFWTKVTCPDRLTQRGRRITAMSCRLANDWWRLFQTVSFSGHGLATSEPKEPYAG